MADRPSAIGGAFRKPFPEQVAFFRNKLGNLVPTARWDDIQAAEHDIAFMVAGAQKADLLTDLAAAVDRSISRGESLDAFRRDFDAAVERNDWHGWTGEGTKGGRAWRTRTIYRTNARTSYAAGRRAQLEAGKFAFWVYFHGGSRDPRPEHLDWDGMALPPDHPFWQTHYPPSDWGCSCYVTGARSERAVARLGGRVMTDPPDGWDKRNPGTGELAGIGRGWGYAPGASVVAAVRAKVRNWEGPIADAFLNELPDNLQTLLATERGTIASAAQLTPGERAAFQSYTAGEADRINASVREGATPTPEAAIMSAVLERSRLPEEVTVFRGLKRGVARAIVESPPAPGAVLGEAGFASTSRAREVGERFRRRDRKNGVLLVIRLPRGGRALDIAELSDYAWQQEIVLHRGTLLRVVSWDAETRTLEVELAADRPARP